MTSRKADVIVLCIHERWYEIVIIFLKCNTFARDTDSAVIHWALTTGFCAVSLLRMKCDRGSLSNEVSGLVLVRRGLLIFGAQAYCNRCSHYTNPSPASHYHGWAVSRVDITIHTPASDF